MARKLAVKLVGVVAVLALANAQAQGVTANPAGLGKIVPPKACACPPSITR